MDIKRTEKLIVDFSFYESCWNIIHECQKIQEYAEDENIVDKVTNLIEAIVDVMEYVGDKYDE